MGSIAYTKPLFRLVKCMILALPWSLNKCADAVWDENLDGLKVWWCGSLKGDELQNMLFWLGGDWESFLPDGEKELIGNISWDPRIFDEWKVKAEA